MANQLVTTVSDGPDRSEGCFRAFGPWQQAGKDLGARACVKSIMHTKGSLIEDGQSFCSYKLQDFAVTFNEFYENLDRGFKNVEEREMIRWSD